MITKSPAYITDGMSFLTLEGAQGHEIETLIDKDQPTPSGLAAWIMANKEKLIDILTTTPTSKPRARKINRKSSNPGAGCAAEPRLKDAKQ